MARGNCFTTRVTKAFNALRAILLLVLLWLLPWSGGGNGAGEMSENDLVSAERVRLVGGGGKSSLVARNAGADDVVVADWKH